ncbi:MIP family Ig-specific serine endopeptidase [Mycoplasma sp. 6243]|uniref:MIP family Ig-specific serine endopeptidase n=1 Tax=Mycoplasma sp. 6243 TaxID=3440865 RepID=UPI003EBEF793
MKRKLSLLTFVSLLTSALAISCGTTNQQKQPQKYKILVSGVENKANKYILTLKAYEIPISADITTDKIQIQISGLAEKLTAISFDKNSREIKFNVTNLDFNKDYKIEKLIVDTNQISTNLVFKKQRPKQEPNPIPQPSKPDKPKEPVTPPPLPPDFHIPTQDYSKNNQYPDFVKQYKVVDRKQLYNEIFDRSFAIKFGVGNKTGDHSNDFRSTDSGTAWLLDYHKQDDNKYKLFLATNLHVAADLSNTLDENVAKKLNYIDPRNIKARSISIGKAAKKTDFTIKENNYNYQADSANTVKWFASADEFLDANKSDSAASETTKAVGISSPKLIFAGFDFIDHKYIQPFQDNLKKLAQERLKKYTTDADPDDESDEGHILKQQLKDENFYPFYTDFAVFEIDIDMSKLNTQAQQMFKLAIAGVDSYLARLNATNQLPNQDKKTSVYMQTVDYMSAFNEKYQNSLTNSKEVYIGGYPQADASGTAAWSINNPTERNSTSLKWNSRSKSNEKTFALPTNSAEEKINSGNYTPYTSAQGRLLGNYYGYNYSIWFSSLYYGASGSLVYNEFGQMIGIYDAVASDVQKNDFSKVAGFAPFFLSHDFGKLKAYNLIDGSDKKKYPAQTASYRQNLLLIYPNGFDNSQTPFKTALFPNGFK